MGEQAVQGAEDRSKTSRSKLKTLRDQYIRDSATDGVCVEDLAQTFSLTEKWLVDGVLCGTECRKREKGEKPLSRQQIDSLKLSFAWFMGQNGYSIEQSNYMLGLTSAGDFAKQERQEEQEQKHRELETKYAALERKNKALESKHEKLKDKADSVLGVLQKQVEGLSKEKENLQKQLSDKDKQLETGNAELEKLKEQLKQKESEFLKKNSELKDSQEDYKQQIESLKQQIADLQKQVKAEHDSHKEDLDTWAQFQEDLKVKVAQYNETVTTAREKIRELEDKLAEKDTEIKVLQEEIERLSQELLSLQETEEEKQVYKGTGKRKLTIEEEHKIMEILKKDNYVVTALALKRIKRAGIEISRQGVYGVLQRFQSTTSEKVQTQMQ